MTKTGTAAQPPMELEDHADNALDWVQKHSRQVSIGAIAVAALVAGTLLWRSADDKKQANATRALSDAQRSFASGNIALAQSDLQRVVQRYGGTLSGSQARILLAQVLFQQKKVAEGLKELDAVPASGPLTAALHAVRAGGLEESGKPADAAAEYLKAAAASVSESDKASNRADAARAYETAGNKSEALKIWKAMADDLSNPLSGEAKLRIGALTAKVQS